MLERLYKEKLVSAEDAAAGILENDMLVFGTAHGEPPAVLSAIAARLRAGDLKKLRVYAQLPMTTAMETVLATDLCDCVEGLSGFVSAGERGLARTGLNQFVPGHFHQGPRILRDFIGVQAAATVVSPMDEAGYFSMGTANDNISTAMDLARVKIVEVNENMPRVFGGGLVHLRDVDFVVENHSPLVVYPELAPSERDLAIGRKVAEMVPECATLQLGWGGLPGAVAGFLEDRRDLGIHTEVFSPALARLIKCGAATGAKKNLHPGKHVYTMAVGDREMLEVMDNNPAMESYAVSYVNHPHVISQNERMVSINSILEVDLFGQANAEFLCGGQFSGTGGQLDYVRGAFDSPGGLSVLAFHSTAKDDTISKVVPRLSEGTVVTTSRQDTHWLVTEHGAANLKGRTMAERALAIIGLAHPSFREGLLRAAEDMRLL